MVVSLLDQQHQPAEHAGDAAAATGGRGEKVGNGGRGRAGNRGRAGGKTNELGNGGRAAYRGRVGKKLFIAISITVDDSICVSTVV